jgi:membrane-associated phospholipid phosphatase
MRTAGTVLITLTLLAAPAAPAFAQAADTSHAKSPSFFTWTDAFLAGGFVATALLLNPLDVRIAKDLQDSTVQANRFFHNTATAFRLMGQPGPQIIGLALYGIGRVTRNQRIEKLAVHGSEAMLLATTITTVTKVTVGRARPLLQHPPSKSLGFGFMRGLPSALGGKGTNYQSFPSGHATTAFAVASASTAEFAHWVDEWHAWNGYKYVVGTVMFGGASLIGASRMYNNAHWTSDVVAGAMVGTFAGLKTVEYNYRHPNNKVERWLVKMTVVPGQGHVPTWVGFSLAPNLESAPRH